ncbi:MAG: hypothetical protein ACI855_001299, partial [Myxococcota bacterium]
MAHYLEFHVVDEAAAGSSLTAAARKSICLGDASAA